MVFTEPQFLFFFLPVLLGFYFILALIGCRSASLKIAINKAQNVLLLVASLLFYAFGENIYVLVMLLSICVNFFCGLSIEKHRGERDEKNFLIFSIAFNLGMLACFKYANFFIENLNVALSAFSFSEFSNQAVHLPIGISFFTFQAMSYTIDVYRKETPAQKSLINLALYISLFPQLIAGPIVRYHDVCKQLTNRFINSDLFASGVRRFLLGLGKKMIIANNIAVPVDEIFNQPTSELTFCSAWLVVVCYALQIYFDFSGYSDMAIGLGRMFGFQFLENFNYPYISTSITEFWRRWHISLSSWFRDYLYIPLGGNRHGAMTTYRNLVLVFFLCGLWHGASWTFVIWGLFHGAFLIIERLGVSKLLESSFRFLRHVYLIIVVLVGWCIFRAESLEQLGGFLSAMLGLGSWVSADSMSYFHGREFQITFLAGLVFSMPILKLFRAVKDWSYNQRGIFWPAIWNSAELIALLLILLYCSMLIAVGTYNPFIYFRF